MSSRRELVGQLEHTMTRLEQAMTLIEAWATHCADLEDQIVRLQARLDDEKANKQAIWSLVEHKINDEWTGS